MVRDEKDKQIKYLDLAHKVVDMWNRLSLYMALAKFLRRNLVSISFPVLTATFIYLDWSHTKNWKLQQQKAQN
uniref:SFRICE_012466 n=1 Tax=Spodoptera frugiperda TaxID=7108 RepID=A0A2H1WN52_SPOFR